jgi:hypothetical protein
MHFGHFLGSALIFLIFPVKAQDVTQLEPPLSCKPQVELSFAPDASPPSLQGEKKSQSSRPFALNASNLHQKQLREFLIDDYLRQQNSFPFCCTLY